jgi:hypothetical protein
VPGADIKKSASRDDAGTIEQRFGGVSGRRAKGTLIFAEPAFLFDPRAR